MAAPRSQDELDQMLAEAFTVNGFAISRDEGRLICTVYLVAPRGEEFEEGIDLTDVARHLLKRIGSS